VFQERRFFAPDGLRVETRLTRTEIADPVAHTLAYCYPDRHVCELRSYADATLGVQQAGGRSSLTRENLGTVSANGLQLIGTREVVTIPGATVGTDRPLTVTKEFWYSPQLAVNITTRRLDPRSGLELFTITDIVQTEPDSALFTLPHNARFIDYRIVTTR
jgi:hypothetical protein